MLAMQFAYLDLARSPTKRIAISNKSTAIACSACTCQVLTAPRSARNKLASKGQYGLSTNVRKVPCSTSQQGRRLSANYLADLGQSYSHQLCKLVAIWRLVVQIVDGRR